MCFFAVCLENMTVQLSLQPLRTCFPSLCLTLLLIWRHLLSTQRNCLSLCSPPPDNELTVGKVYAALMIFDYYKQNRAKRLQQQQSSGGTQVQLTTHDIVLMYHLLAQHNHI